MTVLLGLPDRLKAVRLLVTVEARRGWGAVVRGLPAGCGAVVIVPPTGRAKALGGVDWTEKAVAVLRAEWPATDNGRRLMGIDVSSEAATGGESPARAAAADLLPDMVIEASPTPGWPHKWALHGAILGGDTSTAAEMAVAMSHADVSFYLLQGQSWSGDTVPAGGRPLFTVVEDLADAKQAVDAGATRLAWRYTGTSFFGRIKPPGEELGKATALLTAAFRQAHPDKTPTGKIPKN